MSYGGYNQGGYGQSNPYAQQNSYGNQGGYGGGYNDNVEMQQYNQPAPGGRYGGGLPSGPRPGGAGGYNGGYEGAGYDNQGGNVGGNLLNQCRDIDQAIDDLQRRVQDLQGLHTRVLNDRASNDEVDRQNSEVMAAFRNLGERLKKIKSKPESGSPTNAPQVGRVDRKLKKAINDFQRVESDFRKQMQDAQIRQFKVVNPNATEMEARQAIEDPNFEGGVFQQALMNSNRRGQATTTLNAVRQRHQEIQRIEQTMIELGQLFEDLDRIVMEHEPLIQNIEQKGEEVQQNVEAGVGELDKGVKSARAARRKKWICFWICIAIIIAIVLIVVIYMAVTGKFSSSSSSNSNKNNKRWLLQARSMIEARAAEADPMALMAPGVVL
ncbi:uncharacterized protein PV09_06980 [Verruconis gallopava]|uniref:t-SNARE coiled-coil homology domain-containing protein n=1 Tax=Verruconis gallopava TaxID=253628 RepID=A0A0D1XH40_9PEZI|nr:uncharacterized protein PV09_06980 [Verruconis gallopava]KIW01501.1 hypothetical protein PV09_06980 [Verruconis gallopava]